MYIHTYIYIHYVPYAWTWDLIMYFPQYLWTLRGIAPSLTPNPTN